MSALISAAGLERLHGAGPQAIAALRGVDLEVRHGEFVAVTGRAAAPSRRC